MKIAKKIQNTESFSGADFDFKNCFFLKEFFQKKNKKKTDPKLFEQCVF